MASDSTGSVRSASANCRKKDGDHKAAIERLWERYFAELVKVAGRSLSLRSAADEEDAALSAVNSFYRRATAGLFPRLSNHDDLWRLLVAITRNKAREQVNRELSAKRGGGEVMQEAALEAGGADIGVGLAELAIGREPDPESAAITAEAAEEWTRLLGLLDEQQLEIVAYLMTGCSVKETACQMGVARNGGCITSLRKSAHRKRR